MKVKIEKLDHFGRGITYINDKICFVTNALPEEVVDIEIVNENKKYILAETKKTIEKSPYRIKSQCKYFNKLLFISLSKYLYSTSFVESPVNKNDLFLYVNFIISDELFMSSSFSPL